MTKEFVNLVHCVNYVCDSV